MFKKSDIFIRPFKKTKRLFNLKRFKARRKYNLQKNGIRLSDLQVSVRLAGTEALKNFLREDNCLGFLPKGAILKELRDGDLVALKIEKFEIVRDFFFIQRHGSESNELNKTFISLTHMIIQRDSSISDP